MNTDDLQKLVSREMPFGKYEGRLIADLPADYLHWFARQGFPPGEIGRLLALMREIDHNGLKPLLAPLRAATRPASGLPMAARDLHVDAYSTQPELEMTVHAYQPETLTPEDAAQLQAPTVLEFGANHCGICQGAQPVIQDAMRGADAGITHIKVEDGAGRPLGRSFKVKLWPTLIALRHGQEVGRVVRPTDSESIVRLLGTLR